MKRRFGSSVVVVALSLGVLGTRTGFGQQPAPAKFPELKPQPDQPAAVAPDSGGNQSGNQEEEDPGYGMKREQWFIDQRAYPQAHLPPLARSNALQQHQGLKAAPSHALLAVAPEAALTNARPMDAFTTLSWTFDGPSSLSSGTGATPYSGRATSLAINPTNPSIMYLGTAGGGVWKTTDGGGTWAPITDTQASLAVGAIAIDPNNPNTIYVGTGEADYSGDSYYGQGLLKSTDAGASWTQIAAPFVNSTSASPFAQIAIQPGNSSVLLAATQSGIYRSTNAGLSWTQILHSYASAILFDPNNPSVAYAGMNGYFTGIVNGSLTSAVYKSTDAGLTWTAIPGSGSSALPAGSTVYRTALTLDSSGNLLAGIAPSTLGAGTPYKSSDGGLTWKALTSPGDGLDWYRDWIVSVPGSPNILYAGGVSLFQSLDGGVTWARSNQSYAALLWADQHAAVFSPDGTRMYLMDDGGLFMTANPASSTATFTSLNAGIGSMTFYPGFGISPSGATRTTVVGSQDHGTQAYLGKLPWGYAGGGNVCGDGGPVVLDSAGVYAYAHCQGSPLSFWMSSASGGTGSSGYPYGWVSAQSGIATADRTSWVPPIAADPVTPANMYTGTYRVYQTTNHGATWTAISGDLTGGSSTLSTIAVAPGNPNVVYTGAGSGTVEVSTNALSGTGATWTKLTGLPNRSIAKIVVAPDSPQDVYVVLSGFGTGHVFRSVNGGATWTDLSSNLPNTPADSLALDPNILNTLYLATDTGVYVSSNQGGSWEVLGSNLPNVVVQDIQVAPNSRLLRVITHGRGAWDLTLPSTGFVASTNSLTFAGQTVNTASAAQTVTLTNNLTSAVAITSIATTGPFADTNPCGASLASGASCTVSVTFTPTATGAASGSLTAVTGQGTITVALSGTGLAVSTVSLTASLTFPGQPINTASTAQTATLQNTGGAPLTGIAISLTGANAGDYAQTSTCTATLAAGASCTISVSFTPTASGTRTAILSVADSAGSSPQTATLTGTGTAPAVSLTPSLVFASQALGSSSPPQTATLLNTGSAPLTGIAISLTGANAGDYAQSSTCTGTLAAGASCTVSVVFAPKAAGTRTAALTVTDNAAGSPQTTNLTGTGFAPFTLSATTTTATVAKGASATYALAFASAPGTTTAAVVALSCSGQPSGTSCVFTPSSIAQGTSSQSVSLSLATVAASAGVHTVGLNRRLGGGILSAGILLACCLLPRRRRLSTGVLSLLLLAGLIAGCGGGGGSTGGGSTGGGSGGNPGTTSGTYPITVTAQTSTYSATQALTLVVQ